MKLILGTASLGMKYGVANQQSNVSLLDAHSILKLSYDSGVQEVDTAPAYGDSESVIGSYNLKNVPMLVHTKIPRNVDLDPESALTSLHASIRNLGIPKIEVLYFHSSDSLLSGKKSTVKATIDAIKDSGLVAKVGVSVYSETEVERISNDWPDIEVFQVPENILDQRLLHSRVLSSAAKEGKTFIVRSVFLQGLLLMDLKKIPKHLLGTIPYLDTLNKFALERHTTNLTVTLNYLSLLSWASGFVVGVTNTCQLSEILSFSPSKNFGYELPSPIPYPLVDPRNW